MKEDEFYAKIINYGYKMRNAGIRLAEYGRYDVRFIRESDEADALYREIADKFKELYEWAIWNGGGE